MDDILYNSLDKYFTHLCNTGYIKDSSIKKVMLLAIIEDLLNNDFRGIITEEDYNEIVKVLYCLYGSDCLIPYPDYYSNKNKRIMYIGSMSELSHRVEELEETVKAYEEILDEDVVIPGEDHSSEEDLTDIVIDNN